MYNNHENGVGTCRVSFFDPQLQRYRQLRDVSEGNHTAKSEDQALRLYSLKALAELVSRGTALPLNKQWELALVSWAFGSTTRRNLRRRLRTRLGGSNPLVIPGVWTFFGEIASAESWNFGLWTSSDVYYGKFWLNSATGCHVQGFSGCSSPSNWFRDPLHWFVWQWVNPQFQQIPIISGIGLSKYSIIPIHDYNIG